MIKHISKWFCRKELQEEPVNIVEPEQDTTEKYSRLKSAWMHGMLNNRYTDVPSNEDLLEFYIKEIQDSDDSIRLVEKKDTSFSFNSESGKKYTVTAFLGHFEIIMRIDDESFTFEGSLWETSYCLDAILNGDECGHVVFKLPKTPDFINNFHRVDLKLLCTEFQIKELQEILKHSDSWEELRDSIGKDYVKSQLEKSAFTGRDLLVMISSEAEKAGLHHSESHVLARKILQTLS